MDRSPLILGLSAVFAGLTVLLLAAGAAAGSAFVLFVALPLGLTAAIMWLHGTGRLAASMRAQTTSYGGRGTARDWDRYRRGDRSRTAGRSQRTAGSGPFTDGRGPFTGDGSRFGGQGRFNQRQRWQSTTAGTTGRTESGFEQGMSRQEAARVLGVDPTADRATVKRAYRERVKQHHPDVEGGDEATFKRVIRAYERLT